MVGNILILSYVWHQNHLFIWKIAHECVAVEDYVALRSQHRFTIVWIFVSTFSLSFAASVTFSKLFGDIQLLRHGGEGDLHFIIQHFSSSFTLQPYSVDQINSHISSIHSIFHFILWHRGHQQQAKTWGRFGLWFYNSLERLNKLNDSPLLIPRISSFINHYPFISFHSLCLYFDYRTMLKENSLWYKCSIFNVLSSHEKQSKDEVIIAMKW